MDEQAHTSVPERTVTAALQHLTGPARGTATWLSSPALEVSLADGRRVRISEPGGAHPDDVVVARLHRFGESYEIESCDGRPLWINGRRATSERLGHRDLIEFGDYGPLSRFRIYGDGTRLQKSVTDIFGDFFDYVRVSRRPVPARLGYALRDLLRGFTFETTIAFRIFVIAAIVALATFTYHLGQVDLRLQQQMAGDAERLESFASALTRARKDALRRSDLNTLRQELSHGLATASARLAALEERSAASARVIASAMGSIVFLQGAYGFRETETNRMLRHAVDEEGQLLVSPRGHPLLGLDGDGPVAERQFTGTGFMITATGVLLTNRHVALPWEEDASAESLVAQGMEPVSIKFIGYLPDLEEPFQVTLVKASDDADLAVLRSSVTAGAVPHLAIADTAPQPGDEVIVMGYPAGFRSILAQTGNAFIEELQKMDDLDFWAVAARLSEAGFIRPLASRGIVAQVSPSAIIYDAETTHGGSGGPVLDVSARVRRTMWRGY
jgi:S1-C subfamily serine protease